MVLGADGYLGWPTSLPLSAPGVGVGAGRQLLRRSYDSELGTSSLVPIVDFERRVERWSEITGRTITNYVGDLTDYSFVEQSIASFAPDAIVQFGEQRSAPYSMIDRSHAVYTQMNNVVGNLNLLFALGEIDPSVHLVKLGTMGE